MLGAIYTGLSGMNAYSNGLQAISNNVANLNTSGYKSTSVSFSDLFSLGGAGLTYANGTLGESAGDGVTADTSTIDFAQGDLRQTGNDLDLAIQGSGFLVLINGNNTYYARTGSFVVDKDGFISEQGTNYHLGVLDDTGQPVALNLDAKRTNPPTATTKIVFADNLSSTATSATVSNITVYDSRGGAHVWNVIFTPSTDPNAAPGEWTVTVKDSNGQVIGTSELKFNGSFVDPTTSALTITDQPAGADPLSVTLDFSTGVTSFSQGTTSTIRAASVDGNAVGSLTTVTIDDNGQVKLTYSNDKTELMGAVAIADFRDPQQLDRIGNGLFVNRGNNEQMRLLPSGVDGVGKLVSKQIEASNVNLSDEFGQLILIQRGFQASSQVVSVANDMIQQLFGIRGQG
jgi:flagellar hook protein FlgE